MTKLHSISPTPHSKFSQRVDDITENRENVDVILDEVYRKGFLAGADAELEACVEWLAQNCGRWELSSALRAARRPSPDAAWATAADAAVGAAAARVAARLRQRDLLLRLISEAPVVENAQ